MTNKRNQVEQKLSFLYEKLEGLGEVVSLTDKQTTFLMKEIDYYRTELLKLEVQEYYNLIENEDN
jgi:hypothetical protein